MPYQVDEIALQLLVERLDDEPDPTELDPALEEIVPLVCSFFQQKLAERGITTLSVVWPDQGKRMNREEDPIEQRGTIPAILVSGSWTPAQRDRARELGAARFLAKPVNLAQLARDVEEVAGLT